MPKTKREVFHVVKDRKADRWAVKKEGQGTPLAQTDTKVKAVVIGRRMGNQVQSLGGTAQLKIHKENGPIQIEHTYGADPRRTKG